jgi:hypothetical protein
MDEGSEDQPGHFIWDGQEAHVVIAGEPRTLCGAWPAGGFATTEDADAPICEECFVHVRWTPPAS